MTLQIRPFLDAVTPFAISGWTDAPKCDVEIRRLVQLAVIFEADLDRIEGDPCAWEICIEKLQDMGFAMKCSRIFDMFKLVFQAAVPCKNRHSPFWFQIVCPNYVYLASAFGFLHNPPRFALLIFLIKTLISHEAILNSRGLPKLNYEANYVCYRGHPRGHLDFSGDCSLTASSEQLITQVGIRQ